MRLDWQWIATKLADGWWVIHASLSLILFAMGTKLMDGSPTFDAQAFAAFAEMGTQQEWGVALVAASIIGAAGLLSDQDRVVQLSAAVLCFAHALIAGLFWIGSDATTGTRTYAIIALMALGRVSRGSDA